jgi:hypothetical protein
MQQPIDLSTLENSQFVWGESSINRFCTTTLVYRDLSTMLRSPDRTLVDDDRLNGTFSAVQEIH